MSPYLYSIAGLVVFTCLMVVARKKKFPLTVYIAVCLAASASGAVLFMAIYGYYFGVFNLYFFIVAALIIGLIIDFLVQKAIKIDK